MSLFKKVFLTLALALLLASMIMASFTGCSRVSGRGDRLKEWMQGQNGPRILCTTAQIGDLVSKIGGDRVKVWVLIQGELDPHSYELVKGDDEKIFRAEHIFYNGLNLEHGASLSSLLKSSKKASAIGESIALRHPEKILKRGEIVDPHLWMDIAVWQLAIDPILNQLSALDPEGASYFEGRAEILKSEMEREHRNLQESLRRIPQERRFLLTSHDAFRYFARSYLAEEGEADWQKRFSAPEGLSPEGQLSSVDIQRVIEYLRDHRVSVLFPESNVSKDAIRKIASAGRELGLEVRVCSETLYGDSMSDLGYLEMMRKNGEIIARYLQ